MISKHPCWDRLSHYLICYQSYSLILKSFFRSLLHLLLMASLPQPSCFGINSSTVDPGTLPSHPSRAVVSSPHNSSHSALVEDIPLMLHVVPWQPALPSSFIHPTSFNAHQVCLSMSLMELLSYLFLLLLLDSISPSLGLVPLVLRYPSLPLSSLHSQRLCMGPPYALLSVLASQHCQLQHNELHHGCSPYTD